MSKHNLVKHNPFTLKTSINELFDEFFTLPKNLSQAENYIQNVKLDIIEDDEAYKISADMAGIKKDDINIELDKNHLTVKAKREQKNRDKKHHVKECYYGEYQRIITLPDNIDTDKTEAEYKDGVLNIRIPKIVKTETVKKIAING